MNRLSFLLPIISLLLPGCAFFEPREVTQNEKEMTVIGIARATTTIAIVELTKTREEQLKVALDVYHAVHDKALPGLENPNFLAKDGEQKLLENIKPELRPLLLVAFDTFHAYYRIKSPTELVTPEQAGLIKAFLLGVEAGADDILKLK